MSTTQLAYKEDSPFESDLFLNTAALEENHSDTRMIVPSTDDNELPSNEMSGKNEGVASPFQIHSSVLDSVFSTNLDESNPINDHTPMFDELDFILDGAKVNSKEDWVSLFGDQNAYSTNPIIDLEGDDDDAIVPKDEFIDKLLAETSPHGLSDETVSATTTQASSPALSSYTAATSMKSFSTDKVNKQLATPSTTPLLDMKTSSNKRKLKELKEITISEGDDSVAVKRAKNTLAARKSRERKVQKMSALEDNVRQLTNENERLRSLLSAHNIDF